MADGLLRLAAAAMAQEGAKPATNAGGAGGNGAPRTKVNAPCRAFAATVRCFFGKDCRFNHDGDEKGAGRDDDDGFVVPASRKTEKDSKTGDGKKVDVYGIRKMKETQKVTLFMPASFVEDVAALGEDGEHTHVAISVPKDVAPQLQAMADSMDKDEASLSGKPLGAVRAGKMADALVKQCKATGVDPRERTDTTGDANESDKDTGKFMQAIEAMTAGFKQQQEQHSELLSALSSGGPTKTGKFRSPNGKLRKKSTGSRSSGSSSSAAASGAAAASLPARLFQESDDEDDDDDLDNADDSKVQMIAEVPDEHEDLFKNNNRIKWGSSGTGPAAMKTLVEANPLAEMSAGIIGRNATPGVASSLTSVDINKVQEWELLFDDDVLQAAKTAMFDVMSFWKGFASPGKRIPALLATHYVVIDGLAAAGNRRITTVLLAILIASKAAGKNFPPAPM